MTIANVKGLYRRLFEDKELRQKLNAAENHEARMAVLAEEHLDFTDGEFEDAYGNMLVEVQTAEQHEMLNQFRNWWVMLRSM
ncbi:Nif11-like leader peptide family natural product precursor [Desulfovibrio inopinatus]|uniref:Nif11-like leader peptide family natural product precursor n=1 Tax=Desulfovibrio inopinatus TaxID=102109 RepID=UPI00040ED043|nr:Nif11-like leader peptide family natural product precursor [Desulfovibrio inopinatus]